MHFLYFLHLEKKIYKNNESFNYFYINYYFRLLININYLFLSSEKRNTREIVSK